MKKKGKRKKVWILVILLGLGLVAALYGWRKYHEKRPELRLLKADVEISAVELNSEFGHDENVANKKYLNKIIAVKGIVASSRQSGSSAIVELEGAPGGIGGVNCEMRALTQLPVKGSSVTVKGRCTGYLMDVNIVDAVIQNKN